MVDIFFLDNKKNKGYAYIVWVVYYRGKCSLCNKSDDIVKKKNDFQQSSV